MMNLPLRRVPMRHMYNLRDLGGYPCGEAGMTRFHKLYRSESPHALTGEEWARLYDGGLRLVVDLRSSGERAHHPYDCERYGIRYAHLPLILEGDETDGERVMHKSGFMASLTEGYLQIMMENKPGVCRVLSALTSALDEGAALFHCTAGKDRTGIIAALALLLCGVDRTDIVADYQVAETYNSVIARSFSMPDEYRYLMRSDPETIGALLDTLEGVDLPALLAENGFGREAQQKLIAHMVCRE